MSSASDTHQANYIGSDDDIDTSADPVFGDIYDAAGPSPATKKAKRDRSTRTLTEDEQTIINVVFVHFKLLICTKDPWPTINDAEALAIDAWLAACSAEALEVESADIQPDTKIIQLVCTHIRDSKLRLCVR